MIVVCSKLYNLYEIRGDKKGERVHGMKTVKQHDLDFLECRYYCLSFENEKGFHFLGLLYILFFSSENSDFQFHF